MAPGILQPSQYPWLQSPVELNRKVLTNLRNLNQVSHQNWQEDEQARRQCHVVWADTHGRAHKAPRRGFTFSKGRFGLLELVSEATAYATLTLGISKVRCLTTLRLGFPIALMPFRTHLSYS